MEPEFIIKTVMAIVGTGLIAAGIVLIIRGKKTASKVWGAVLSLPVWLCGLSFFSRQSRLQPLVKEWSNELKYEDTVQYDR